MYQAIMQRSQQQWLRQPNDTIVVAAGNYNENVNLNKAGLILQGAKAGVSAGILNPPNRGAGESIVNGTITISAADVVVDGFEVHSAPLMEYLLQALHRW